MTKEIRKIIEIDEELCNGCGECIMSCAEGALEIREGKARVIGDKFCDGLGACLGECPTDALRIVEREAEPFDEEAVEELLRSKKQPGECPSGQPLSACEKANVPEVRPGRGAGNWPVQIRLVPPNAPFLKDADLLVAADCGPAAAPGQYAELLENKVLLLGCPKFDDREAYVEKFARIFGQNSINSVTVLVMEVPCCQGLPGIVNEARKRSGANVPVNVTILGRDGTIKDRPMTAPDPQLQQLHKM